MACSAATIRSHAVLLICLSLPGTSLSKAAGSFQDPEDLLKVIVSVPVGDRQKALALLDEHKDLVNQAFCRLLLSARVRQQHPIRSHSANLVSGMPGTSED